MIDRRRLSGHLLVAGIAASATIGLGGLAQSQESGATGAQPADTTQAAESGEESLRERLARRLEWTRERIGRYQEHEKGLVRAIERLDSGEAPAEIYSDMRHRVEESIRERRDGDDRDRDDRGGDRRGGHRVHKLDPESREQLLKMLETHAPGLGEQVSAIRRDDADQSDRLLQRLAPKLSEIRDAQDRDPALATLMIRELHANLELTVRSRDLRELMTEEDPDKAALGAARERVRESLTNSFDAHLALKEHEIRELEQRLQVLRTELEKRQDMRDEFIDRQFERVGSPLVDPSRPRTRG